MPYVYQGMTCLPRELETALLGYSHERLVELLKKKSKISGTDTAYSAVQWLAKVYTEAELAKIVAAHPGPDPEPVFGPRPAGQPSEEPKQPREKAPPNPNAHPQHIINEKTAALKEAGGSIRYDRGSGGWLLESPTRDRQVISSAVFRDSTIPQLLSLIQ